jgi:hypothetical protein
MTQYFKNNLAYGKLTAWVFIFVFMINSPMAMHEYKEKLKRKRYNTNYETMEKSTQTNELTEKERAKFEETMDMISDKLKMAAISALEGELTEEEFEKTMDMISKMVVKMEAGKKAGKTATSAYKDGPGPVLKYANESLAIEYKSLTDEDKECLIQFLNARPDLKKNITEYIQYLIKTSKENQIKKENELNTSRSSTNNKQK